MEKEEVTGAIVTPVVELPYAAPVTTIEAFLPSLMTAIDLIREEIQVPEETTEVSLAELVKDIDLT